MESLANLATRLDVDIIEVIQAARKAKISGWVTPEQAQYIARQVHERFPLDDQEIEEVETFLTEDPKSKEVLGQFVGLEGLISPQESEQVLDAVSRKLLTAMGPKYSGRLNTRNMLRVILNLGVLDVYRAGKGTNNTENFVRDVIIPANPELGARLLSRYYMNKMQTMTLEGAQNYLKEIRERWEKNDQ